jgi:hypothetical protein
VGGSSWRHFLARREGVLRAVVEDDAGSGHHAAQRAPDPPTWRANCQGVRPGRSARGLPKQL